jgi:hypothetical protein
MSSRKEGGGAVVGKHVNEQGAWLLLTVPSPARSRPPRWRSSRPVANRIAEMLPWTVTLKCEEAHEQLASSSRSRLRQIHPCSHFLRRQAGFGPIQEGLGSLLSVIQRAFNEALKNEKDVPEHVEHFPIHFDYIESQYPNAHAFRDEEYSNSYIGVTMGLVYQLGDVSVALSRSDAVTDLLNIHLTPEVRDGLHAMPFQTL